MLKLTLTLATLYALYLTLLYAFQREVVFPRRFAGQGRAQAPEGVERWWRDVPGGQVEAWFIPGKGVSPEAPGPLVVFGHGNGDLIDGWWPGLRPYHQRGVSVLLPEFRGYGRSGGDPSQAGIVEDFAAFLGRAEGRPEIDGARVYFHGFSLGGGVVGALARLRPPAALILQSTFTSTRALASRFLAPGFLMRDPFPTGEVLARLDAPVLVVHGRQDEVVPHSHGEALAALARDGRLLSRDCRHGDCPLDATYWQAIWETLERQ